MTIATHTMRALAKTHAGPGAELVERPVPIPGAGEVLLQVEAASICGTDLHLFTWDEWAAENLVPPRILGHELAGTVVATGSGVRRVAEGDLVGVESHLFDWTCARRMDSLHFQSLAETLQVEEEVLCRLIAFLAVLSQRLGDDAVELGGHSG